MKKMHLKMVRGEPEENAS